MKKILLSLFAIATMFVACDKEDSVIEPTGQPVADIGNQITEGPVGLSDIEILEMVSEILGTDLINGSKVGDLPSAGKGDDRITLHIFQLNGANHIAFVDDSNDDFCFNAQDGFLLLASVHLNNDGSNNIEVTLDESNNVISTVNGDFTTLFSLPFNLIMKLAADGAVDSQELYSAHNVGSIGGNTVRFGCAGDYFAITDAPFPLNGHLATITDAAGLTAAFGGSSVNYAGTSEADVEAAIMANIMDGN